MKAPTIRRAGVDALLLDVGALEQAMAWHAHLNAQPLPGQLEALAAAQTVLLRFDTPEHATAAIAELGTRTPSASVGFQPREHRLEVVYDGEDLAELARLTGLSVDGVIAAHTGTPWTAAFGGFAPGFTYLTGGDPVLDVPRRSSPRTAVPAGAVALAGRFSAVYPRQSPGGWQLLGRTSAALWDATRERPALIAPGDVVSFVPVRETASLAASVPDAASGASVPGPPGAVGASAGSAVTTGAGAALASAGSAVPVGDPASAPTGASGDSSEPGTPVAATPALTVLSPGLRTLIQDLGRPGRGDLGVTVSGAVDRRSAAQANRLVGNPEGTPLLETLLGGLELQAHQTVVLALAGAVGTATIQTPATSELGSDGAGGTEAAGSHVAAALRSGSSRTVEARAPFALRPGETLSLDSPAAGLRGYVAVRGGLDVALELGSAASDTLSGLGPSAVAAGQELAVGHPAPGSAVGHPEAPATALPAPGETVTLRATPGPRDDWFGAAGLAALQATRFRVAADSDRVGARLELDPAAGEQAPLARVRQGELSSEGVVAGSLQVPPSGLPVLFLADHPVTGGYPVIGVVLPQDLAVAAQLPPGTPVRITLVDQPAVAAAHAAPAAPEGASK